MSLSLGTVQCHPGKTPPGWAGLGSQGPLGHIQNALWLLRFEVTPIWAGGRDFVKEGLTTGAPEHPNPITLSPWEHRDVLNAPVLGMWLCVRSLNSAHL